MDKLNGLPVYNIGIEDVDGEYDSFYGISTMSIVESPAVDKPFLTFGKKNKKNSWFTYSSDSDRQIVTGVAVRADYPIYRNDGGEEFYVTFSKEVIEQAVQKFMMERRNGNVNIDHNPNEHKDDIFLFESFILRDELKYSNPEFKDVANGSWMTSYKVNNSEVWQQIKQGKLTGFSIELNALLYGKQPKAAKSMDSIEVITSLYELYVDMEKMVRHGGKKL